MTDSSKNLKSDQKISLRAQCFWCFTSLLLYQKETWAVFIKRLCITDKYHCPGTVEYTAGDNCTDTVLQTVYSAFCHFTLTPTCLHTVKYHHQVTHVTESRVAVHPCASGGTIFFFFLNRAFRVIKRPAIQQNP